MNLALCHCGKEWRAQRGILIAYSLLVFTSLCLGFLLVPEHWWLEDGRRAMGLSWFVAAGVIGVVVFAAPALVRAEFGQKDDQFVRRLPGALGPSFHGKVLFLVLATLALPLVGLLWGEVFLQATGIGWHDLFAWRYDGEVVVEPPWPTMLCVLALLLTPWVWAIGTWLPGGRMAVGGTGLFVLLLGVGVFAVLRQSPNLEQGIAWQTWLWGVVPLGFVVAGISWGKGRRGGGALRSARFGLAATAIGLLPPAAWFGNAAWIYHHPDLQRLAQLYVVGIGPDHRYALAYGAGHTQWNLVPLRVDLRTGEAEQLGTTAAMFAPDFGQRSVMRWQATQRYWHCADTAGHRAFDLQTGVFLPIDYDTAAGVPILPADLRVKVADDVRAATPLRAPGNRRVWLLDGDLRTEEPDGFVSRRPFSSGRLGMVRPAGHAFEVATNVRKFFALDGNEVEQGKQDRWLAAHCVRDRWVFVPRPRSLGQWHQLEPSGDEFVCEPLRGVTVLGLFDDDHLLCHVAAAQERAGRVFLYRPLDRAVVALPMPADVLLHWVHVVWPMDTFASLLPRDPAGRIWLSCADTKGRQRQFVAIDTATRAITVSGWSRLYEGSFDLIAWPDAQSMLVRDDTRIVRLDTETGACTVLFPRH